MSLDNIINFYKKKYNSIIILTLIAISLYSFKDSKNFLNNQLGTKAGYFMIPTFFSEDYRLSQIIDNIENNTSTTQYKLIVETDNWPIMAGISSILLRKGNQVITDNYSYNYFFKLPIFQINNQILTKIYISKSLISNKKLIYHDNDLYIYVDYSNNGSINLNDKKIDTSNLLNGWSNPEGNYIWAIGPESTIIFDSVDLNKEYNIEIKCKTPFGLKRKVDIYLNNNYFSSFQIENIDYQIFNIKLPNKYLNYEYRNVLTMKFPDSIELSKIGYSDSRNLALQINYFKTTSKNE